MSFAERLAQAMEENGCTPKELCRKAGLARSSVSQYLTGKFVPPDVRVRQLAGILCVSPEWLRGNDELPEGTGTVAIEVAARLMGVPKQYIRVGLQSGELPFGRAVQMPNGHYRYYISPKRFTEFTGIAI